MPPPVTQQPEAPAFTFTSEQWTKEHNEKGDLPFHQLYGGKLIRVSGVVDENILGIRLRLGSSFKRGNMPLGVITNFDRIADIEGVAKGAQVTIEGRASLPVLAGPVLDQCRFISGGPPPSAPPPVGPPPGVAQVPGGPPGQPGQPVDPNAPKAIPPGYKGVAQQLTDKGKHADARLYLYAAAVMDPNDVVIWKNVRWCQALERPVLGLRWAMGYTLTGAKENMPNQGQPAQPLPADQAEQQIQQERQRAFDQTTGIVGQKTLEALLIRHSAGFFGAKPANPQPNQPNPQPGQGNHPYATFIGSGDKKILLDAAKRADADALLWFEVQVGTNKKTNQSVATITARVMDPSTGRQLVASKPLSSAQISTNPQNPNLVAGGALNDPVALFVESITTYIDKQMALTDTPELEAEKVNKRLASQLLKTPENPLPLLLELAVYEQKKSLPANEVTDYRKKLIGEREAQVLQGKDEAEQRQIMQRWLPRLPADVVMNTGAPGGIPAIGGRTQPGDPGQGGNGQKTEPTAALLEGRNLLNESLSNLRFVDPQGKPLDLSAFKGKVVLVDFWAAANPLTTKSAASRKDLFAAHQARGFEIVGVLLDADRTAGDALVKDKGWTWTQFFDGQGVNNAVSRALGVRTPGVSLLLDKTGKVRYVNLGPDDMNKAVALLVAE